MEKDGYDSPGSGFSERVEKEILRLESEGKKARAYSYIVIPDSGIWRKIGHRTFYRLYGLHYFNKSDDPRTSGIQKAINTAKSMIFIKDGRYTIKPVVVPGTHTSAGDYYVGLFAKSNKSIVGETEFGTILAGNGNVSYRFDLVSFGYNEQGQAINVSNWVFKDLTLDGTNMVSGYLSGFRWANSNATGSNGRFENINVQNLVPNATPPTDGYAFAMRYMGPTKFQRIVVRNVEAHNVGSVWVSALVDYLDIDGIYGDNMFGVTAGSGIVGVESGAFPVISHVRGVAPAPASGSTSGVLGLAGVTRIKVTDVAAFTYGDGIVISSGLDGIVSDVHLHGPSQNNGNAVGIHFLSPGNQNINAILLSNFWTGGFNTFIKIEDFPAGYGIYNLRLRNVHLFGGAALPSGQAGLICPNTPLWQFSWDGGTISGMTGVPYAVQISSGSTGFIDDVWWDGYGAISIPPTIRARIRGYNLGAGWYQIGFNIATPAMPASGTAQANNNPYPVIVYLYGGTVTQITINGQVVFSSGTGISLTGQSFTLNPGDTIAITYTAAPTWKWYGL